MTDVPTRPCPRCGPFARLEARQGVLHEAVCPRCRGRFLPTHARETLLAEMQVDDTMLREMISSFGGESLPCPGCGYKTTSIHLRGRYAHMCTGCGGMWLDQGDFTKVTDERHREVGVTDVDERELALRRPPPRKKQTAPDQAPGFKWVRRWLGLTFVLGMTALQIFMEQEGTDAARRFLYTVMATSGYVLWFLPTLWARRKKSFLSIFAANLASVLLPPAWLGVMGWSVVAPGLEELTEEEKRLRRLGPGSSSELMVPEAAKKKPRAQGTSASARRPRKKAS